MKIKTEEITKDDILIEVLQGLSQSQKTLPSKLLYDQKGSMLFDEICELDEYYPTRTEMQIMNDNIIEMGSLLGDGTMLVELGSGSSQKIKLLLDHIPGLAGYIPVDISSEHLIASSKILKYEYPHLKIFPLVADYTKPFDLPQIDQPFDHKAVYFPGSTIGNFIKSEAREFINRIADISGYNGGLIIGVDLRKDKEILEAAYNDKKGVTADFNLNILNHINNELNSNFELENFHHKSIFNVEFSRIEMHLISNKNQLVKIGNTEIDFLENEKIITEYSYKYTLEDFKDIASDKFEIKKVWTDSNNLFSIQYLKVKN